MVSKSLSPEWGEDEGSTSLIVHKLSSQRLEVRVMDEDAGFMESDDLLGRFSVALTDLVSAPGEHWYNLEQTPGNAISRVKLAVTEWSRLTLDVAALKAAEEDHTTCMLFIGVASVATGSIEASHVKCEARLRGDSTWMSTRQVVPADGNGATIEDVLPPIILRDGPRGHIELRVVVSTKSDKGKILPDIAVYDVSSLLHRPLNTHHPQMDLGNGISIGLILQVRAAVPAEYVERQCVGEYCDVD